MAGLGHPLLGARAHAQRARVGDDRARRQRAARARGHPPGPLPAARAGGAARSDRARRHRRRAPAVAARRPLAAPLGARIVIDLYCPETLETLELLAGQRAAGASPADRDDARPPARRAAHGPPLHLRERDAARPVARRDARPAADRSGAYDRDPSLRAMIDLVPFGVPDAHPPRRGERTARDDRGTRRRQRDRAVERRHLALARRRDGDPRDRRRLPSGARRLRLVFMGGGRNIRQRRRARGSARARRASSACSTRSSTSTTAGCPTPSALPG